MGGLTGELALWRAVIDQAFRDGLKYADKGGAQANAYCWFKENRWQFRFVCDLAGVDPDAVRDSFLRAARSSTKRPRVYAYRRTPTHANYAQGGRDD